LKVTSRPFANGAGLGSRAFDSGEAATEPATDADVRAIHQQQDEFDGL